MLGTAFWYIADVFFIARISLAAAMAPGEAAFGGAAACCAEAGNAAIARANARPAAGKILKTLFIPFLLGKQRRSLPLNNANSLRTRQNGRAGETEEQPVLDSTRDCAQKARQTRGILDAPRWASTIQWPPSVTKTWPSLGLSDRHLLGYATFRKRLGWRHCPRMANKAPKNGCGLLHTGKAGSGCGMAGHYGPDRPQPEWVGRAAHTSREERM